MAARRRTSIARPAAGLPRYYQDCGWHQGPAWVGATLAEIGLMGVMRDYCTKHGTDGRLPADVEALAAACGVRASEARKALRSIEARRKPSGEPVVVRDGTYLVLVGYADHNPTADEVKAYTAERSQAGRRGNHKRWHVDKGVVDPECDLCTEASGDPPPSHSDRSSDRSSDSGGDRSGVAPGIADASHGMGWDGSSDLHPQTTSSGGESLERDDRGKPPGPEPDPDPSPRPTSDPDDRARRARAACEHIGQQAHQERLDAGTVTSPPAHRRSVIAGAIADHHDQAIQLAGQHPDWTPERIANAITGTGAVPLDESQHPAVLADRTRIRYDDADPLDRQTTADRAAAARAALAESQRPDDHHEGAA